MEGVWIDPVTAQVMMILWEADIGKFLSGKPN